MTMALQQVNGTTRLSSQQLIARRLAERAAADANWARLTQTPFDQMGPSRPFTPAQQVGVDAVLRGTPPPFTGTVATPPPFKGVLPTPPPFRGTVATPPPFTGTLSTPPPHQWQNMGPNAWQPGNVGGAVLGPGRIASGGLMDAARSAFRSGGVARTPLRFGSLGGAAATIGGNLLDESQLLGGSESAANDATSKMLKWGGLGATIGTVVPGVGTLLGGAGGAVVGLIHEGLERQGVLGTPSKSEQAQTLIANADKAASEIGLPNEVLGQLRASRDAEMAFLDPKDTAARLDLATRYANAVQQSAVAFAENPEMFAGSAQADEAAQADRLIMQSVMVNAVKPYADQMIAQSNAEADAYENMARSSGDLAPMYEQMAGQTRSRGARYATEIVQQAQITPYQQAAEQQAQYLKQIANQTMSQAIGQVMSPQSNAGSTDLTAIIDQYANAAQPQ